ncbi:MAG: aminoacyl-tRNA hydrolase [Nautilia sp.]|nr:MAG: aminoacyl-tRNA hydrolase [Nautilia sp.]
MTLIVGLGNIGNEYENTRHNIGFIAIDKILSSLDYTSINKATFKGELFKSGDYIFLKPSTYMNLSGESVSAVKNFYKIENDNIIVIHDDLDLKLGTLKFKKGGGNAGHNGLKSIDKHIGNDYHRIRIGIGRPQNKEIPIIDYVLGKFKKEELGKLEPVLENVEKAIFDWNDKTPSKYSLKG